MILNYNEAGHLGKKISLEHSGVLAESESVFTTGLISWNVIGRLADCLRHFVYIEQRDENNGKPINNDNRVITATKSQKRHDNFGWDQVRTEIMCDCNYIKKVS